MKTQPEHLLVGVREYCEGMNVTITQTDGGRLVIKAWNEAGCNSTEVDLIELLTWVKANMPAIWTLIP